MAYKVKVRNRGHACSDAGTMANVRIETDERISVEDLLERVRVALESDPAAPNFHLVNPTKEILTEEV